MYKMSQNFQKLVFFNEHVHSVTAPNSKSSPLLKRGDIIITIMPPMVPHYIHSKELNTV